jgi:hypothetical protein
VLFYCPIAFHDNRKNKGLFIKISAPAETFIQRLHPTGLGDFTE